METDWAGAIAEVSPQVVRIETATGHGTGFVCYGGEVVRTVATAYHVIDGAFGKPLTIRSGSQAITFGRAAGRDIKVARLDEFDAALLILPAPELPKPVVPMLEKEKPLVAGTEVGWLGFPHLAAGLCFFSGRISAVYEEQFLVDGTAIHGVSGGPAFCSTKRGLRIVGSISAYLPNLAVKERALPGLSVITHVFAHRNIRVTGG